MVRHAEQDLAGKKGQQWWIGRPLALDRVFDLLDSAFSASQADEGYPPLNITKTDETCRSRWLRPARSIDRGAGECADRFWQKTPASSSYIFTMVLPALPSSAGSTWRV